MSTSQRIFVYGTLKRDCKNHHFLTDQTFVDAARTVPGFSLYDLGGYPGMVANAGDIDGVTGEIWSVDAACLRRIDALEGLAEGLYRREPVPLLSSGEPTMVDAYLYARSVAGRREIGSTWRE